MASVSTSVNFVLGEKHAQVTCKNGSRFNTGNYVDSVECSARGLLSGHISECDGKHRVKYYFFKTTLYIDLIRRQRVYVNELITIKLYLLAISPVETLMS